MFGSIKTKHKLISRRKDKKQKDLEDMISLFKTTDPDQLPVFVAYHLHKLPPLSFDHVDVSKLLRDILAVRAEITEIKEKYVTKEQLEIEISTQKVKNPLPNPLFNQNVNKIRGGGYTMDSGPFGLLPLQSEAATQDDTVLHSGDESEPQYRSLARPYTQDAPCDKVVAATPVNSTVLESSALHNDMMAEVKVMTMAETLKQGVWSKKKPDDDWIQVQRKRHRNRFDGKTGTAISNSTGNFKAAETKIPLFISNVNKGTTDKDICDYILKMTQEVVQLEKVSMKTERPYNAFKLFVSKNKMNVFLDDKLWPEGIKFRRFIYFKTGKDKRFSRAADDNLHNT